VRKFTYQGMFDYYVNGAGSLETRVEGGSFNTEFESSDQFAVAATREYELLQRPTPIAGVTWPAGSYTFTNGQVSYTLGAQRRVSGTLSCRQGSSTAARLRRSATRRTCSSRPASAC
jgi:hypothetical protein